MPVKIFFCYAQGDKALLNKLKTHFRSLERQGLIDMWSDGEIYAGVNWEQEITRQLNNADIILLLLSSDFMESDYCYGSEMKRALERHAQGECVVIPIILRQVYWSGGPLGKLQALPTDGKPIIGQDRQDQDSAFFDVVAGVYRVIQKITMSVEVELSNKDTHLNSEVIKQKEGASLLSRTMRADSVNVNLEEISYNNVSSSHHVHNGEIPRIKNFYGREKELRELKQWIENEHCQLILLLGAKGIGKTTLAVKLVEQVKSEFEYVCWYSLQNTPPLEKFLQDCIQNFSRELSIGFPDDIEAQIILLIESLKNHHCLLIIDNVEAVRQFGNRIGQYRKGYEKYRRFFQRIGETQHQSCLLLISRENHKDFARLQGKAPSLNKSLSLLDRDMPTLNVWNVPYRRDPFFTGRENLLIQLYDQLATNKSAALIQPQAISGLGGIGKTQVAVEYAHRYRGEYPVILWIGAATRETIITAFINIADLLHLPEYDEKKQSTVVVTAVKEWLAFHTGWLLIFDNVETVEIIDSFLPKEERNGHILLTTRLPDAGRVANTIAVEKMTTKEGTSFLLKRTKKLKTDMSHQRVSKLDRISANAIVDAVDGLPLALDQAGAYIEETECSVTDYLHRYKDHYADLLKLRRLRPVFEEEQHPDSVATTWSVSFENIVQNNPGAADLLKLCAFLAPDAISEEMLLKGASQSGSFLEPIISNSLHLDRAISELRRFSFVRRKDRILSIHRLVQVVLREWMTKEERYQWAERTVQIVNAAFPHVTPATWAEAQRYLPQAEACALLIEEYSLYSLEAAGLMHQAGWYLRENARYGQSEHLLLISLTIYRQTEGGEPGVAHTLNRLALLYHVQGRFSEIEPLYQEAYSLYEKASALESLGVARVLNNWAEFHRVQSNYSKAEPLYLRSLEIRQKVETGTRHIALILNNLGRLSYARGHYVEAEAFYQRAMTIWEKIWKPGQSDPQYPAFLDNLSRLYYVQGEYDKAESFMEQAVTIRQEILGAKHPQLARSLSNLAKIYCSQGHRSKAESFILRALAICEQALGPKHHSTLSILENLVEVYHIQERYSEVELFYPRIQEIYASLDIPGILALKFDEPIFQQILVAYEKVPNHDDPEIATIFEMYATQLQQRGRLQESILFEAQARAIRAKLLP